MNKKDRIKYIGIAVIIIGTVLIGIDLLVFSSKKDNKKTENNEKIEEKESITMEVENDIPEEYESFYPQITENTASFDTYLSHKYPIEKIGDLSSIDKTLFLLNNISDTTDAEITVQQLSAEMNKYFTTFDLHLGDISDSNGNILYSYVDGKYTYEMSEDALPYEIYTQELSNKATFDSWIVQKKIYYVKGEIKNGKIKQNVYANPNSEKIIYSYDNNSNISMSSLSNEEYLKIKDKLSTITYTYKRVGDTYLLESVI